MSFLKKFDENLFLKRFSNLKTFKVFNYYACGSAPGGEFFDIAESHSGAIVFFVFAKSNQYRVSRLFPMIFSDFVSECPLTAFLKSSDHVKDVFAFFFEKLKKAFVDDQVRVSMTFLIFLRDLQCFYGIQFGKSLFFYTTQKKRDDQETQEKKELENVEKCQFIFSPTPPLQKNFFIENFLDHLFISQGVFEKKSQFFFLSEGVLRNVSQEELLTEILEDFQKKESSLIMNQWVECLNKKKVDDFLLEDATIVLLEPHFRLTLFQGDSNS